MKGINACVRKVYQPMDAEPDKKVLLPTLKSRYDITGHYRERIYWQYT